LVQSTKIVKVRESFLRRGQYIIVEILKLNIIIYKGLLSSSIYLDNPRVLDNPKVLGLVLLGILVLLGTYVIVLDNPKS
jgi:hypothetical protein